MKRRYKRYRGYESVLILAVFILVFLGIVMVFSSSSISAYRRFGDPYYFFKRHILFVCAGTGICFLLWKIRLKDVLNTRFVYVVLLLSFLMLLLTITPLGYKSGGAKRWLKLGVFSFQPLEFAKIALVLYLAYFFSSKRELIKQYLGFLIPFLVTSFLAVPLIFQPDFGGFVFLFIIFFFLAFVGGVRLRHILFVVIPFGIIASLLVCYSPYRFNRLLSYIYSLRDMEYLSYQIKQSVYALGCGGFFGVGLGESKQKLFYLPESFTDFVISILGEELGFLGVSFVFICLGLILFVVFINFLQKEDMWDKLVILGMGAVVLIGALLHVAVVLGAVPPKGIPMPFISYGGSNLVAMFISIGILLNTIRAEKI